MAKLDNGEVQYDFVEVMACPGGCIGGAGQPQAIDSGVKKARARSIYSADKLSQLRKSQDNPVVAKLYEKWLKKPNSHEAHETLHTSYSTRARITGEDIELLNSEAQNQVDLAVCVGTCCYLKGSYDTLQEFIHQAEQAGIKDRINLHATFCLEGCKDSPSVRLNNEVVGGITPEKVKSFIKDRVIPELNTKEKN